MTTVGFVGSALFCVVVVYVYPLSLSTPLFDPDEGLHAVIAQEMVGAWRLSDAETEGTFFRDKPILYFAAQALSLRAFGMTEAAVRLPGFLFALLGAGTTWLLARRWHGRAAGMIALLSALTMAIPMAIAQAGIHDVALVPWTNLLLLCLWESDHTTSGPKRWALLSGGVMATALAMLTKGLIGIAVVGVGYVAFVLLSRQCVVLTWRAVSDSRVCGHPVGQSVVSGDGGG